MDAPELADLDGFLRAVLDEDLGSAGDITSRACFAADVPARGRLVAKADGVLAGLPIFRRVVELCEPQATVTFERSDGDRVNPGDVVATLAGRAQGLLAAERTALNLLQQLSGVATYTARLVALAGTARVLDTRKTVPGLRRLQKYAVRCGGGHNHRMGLYDEVMVKDNHVDLAGRSLAELLPEVRAAVGPQVRVTAEARDRDEALAAIAGGADVVLLDNFAPGELEELVPALRAADKAGRVELEVSGGVDESTLAAYAAVGVDRVSIGALTHSAKALDLSLELEAIS